MTTSPIQHTHSRPSVLILEDEPYTITHLSAALEILGLDATVVHSVLDFEEAIRRSAGAIQACILDINLGEDDTQGGLDALEIVRAEELKLWVAVYTSYHGGRPKRMAESLGADLFLEKSADRENDAACLLEHWLANQRFDSARLYNRTRQQRSDPICAPVLGINHELMRYLASNPNALRCLEPRKLEEVVAEIWYKFGYEVVLTPRTRDGGKDIYAAKHDVQGDVLYVIECKRYATGNPVGVELVRALYGVAESERATMGILATTSYFTEPARAFQRLLPYRLSLRDYQGLTDWLAAYLDSPQP